MSDRLQRTAGVLLALLLLAASAFPTFAGEGDGDGSGSGGGREVPLTLEHASIANGAVNVDPNERIVLQFSKNVVHFNVKERNMACFSVEDSKGNDVPIDVVMGDDQVDPDIKRIVTIVPKSPYKTGETYLLTVHRGLIAKNEENILQKDVYLSFTVGEAAVTKPDTTMTAASTTEATSQYVYWPSAGLSPATTATTKAATTTTTAASLSARAYSPIRAAAAAATTAKRVATTAAQTRQASADVPSTAVTLTAGTAAQPAPTAPTEETQSGDEPQTETQTVTEAETTVPQTDEAESTAVPDTQAETASAAETAALTSNAVPKRITGIVIACAAAAAAIVVIWKIKKKKG